MKDTASIMNVKTSYVTVKTTSKTKKLAWKQRRTIEPAIELDVKKSLNYEEDSLYIYTFLYLWTYVL